MRKKETNELDDILNSTMDFEPTRPPVALSKAKIRSAKRLMRDIMLDILNTEYDDGDSRAERMLDAIVEKAENGDTKSVEMVLRIIKELDDKAKVDVSIPSIKIVVDGDNQGIRYREKE